MGVHARPIDLVGSVGYPVFSVTVICVVPGPLVMNITSSLCALHWPLCVSMSALCLFLAPDHSVCLFGSRTTVQDLREAVRFVHECFVFRSGLLVPVG
jgi:hypothetical protein